MPLTASASRLPMKESCAISEIGGGCFIALYMAHGYMTVFYHNGRRREIRYERVQKCGAYRRYVPYVLLGKAD